MDKVRIILSVAVVVLLVIALRNCNRPTDVRIVEHRDTVIVRDTLRDTVFVPKYVRIVRIDTVLVQLPGDTVKVPVSLPIERKTYATDNYKAVIEGWHPELIELEIYPVTKYITTTRTETVRKRSRFGIGVQAGYGTDGRRLTPYVGVGVQYNLWSF